jgi:hypothetical protein
MKKKNKIGQYMKSMQRKSAIEQGFYDGRFRNKFIEDKKKVNSKNACKNWNDEKNLD